MKKLLLLFTLLIGNLFPVFADEYSIVFKDDASDETSDATPAKLLDEIVEGKDYVASFSAVSKVYVGSTGLKFGSSKAGGTVIMNLAEVGKVEATGIKVELEKYGNDAMDFTVSINGGTTQELTSGVTLELDGQEVNSFKFTSTKRLYLKSITVYYGADDERIDPSFVWSADEATVEYSEDESHVYELPNIINNIHNLTLTYASDNEVVATVDPTTGEVTILSIGTAQISAAFIGNDEFKTKTEAYTLIVEPSRAAGFVYGDLTPALFGHTSTNYGDEEYTSELRTLVTYKANYGCNSGNFTFNHGGKSGVNSGIVVTDNPLRLLLHNVIIKGGNSNRNLEVYGANIPFTETTPDWDNNELIGVVGDVNDETDVELCPESDYEYAAIWPAKGNEKSMQFTLVTLIWKEPDYVVGANASISNGGISATFNVLVGTEALSDEAEGLFKVYILDGDNKEEIGVCGTVINNLSDDPNVVYVVESPVTQRLFEIKAADIANWPTVGDNKPATPAILVDNNEVEVVDDCVTVDYGSTITFVSTYSTSLNIADEDGNINEIEGNQYSFTAEKTTSYTVKGVNGNGTSEEVEFYIFLADPTISVTYSEGTVENEGEYNVLESTEFIVTATGYKTLTVIDSEDNVIELVDGKFIPSIGEDIYTVTASNGEKTVELIFTVNVEKVMKSVFDFAHGAVYGMEVLSGSTTEYANNPTICKESPVTLVLSGDNAFRLWSTTNGSELRTYKNGEFIFSTVPGYEIVEIDIVGELGSFLKIQEGTCGEFNAGIWTGNSNKVVLVTTHTSGNKKATAITVTYKEVLTPVGKSTISVNSDKECNILTLEVDFVKGDEVIEVSDLDLYKVYVNDIEFGTAERAILNVPYVENAVYTVKKEGEQAIEIENPWKDVLSATAKVVNPVYTARPDANDNTKFHLFANFELDVNSNFEADLYIVDFFFEKNGETLYELELNVDNGVAELSTTAHLYWGLVDNKLKPMCQINSILVQDSHEFDTDNVAFDFEVIPTFPFLMTPVSQPSGAAMHASRAAEPTINYVNATKTAINHTHMGGASYEVSGVADVVVDGEAVVEFYNLQGVKVEGELAPGLYIRRQGNEATKVVVK